MADDRHHPDNPEIKELVRVVRELGARVQRLEMRVDQELADKATDTYLSKPNQATSLPQTTHSALESRIASQWLNKVGVVAVLFGVAYLLRYAFLKQWVSAAVWIWLGVCSGILVMVGSEWFRRRGYRVLSLSLKSTGIGVSYLSLWAGLELYNLLSGPETFAGLVCLTVLGAFLALRESAEVLAGLALIGGYLTPLLISIPSLEWPLFAYLAILDCAMAVIVLRRDWWKLLPIGFLGTLTLCAIWYFNHYRRSELAAAVTAATLFFAIFCAVLLVRRMSAALMFPPLVLLEVGNPLLYFVVSYLLLDRVSRDALTVLTLAVAALYFLVAWRLERRLRFGVSSAVAVYGGLGITFVALFMAVLLRLEWLSLGWFAEAAVIMAIGFWKDLSWLRWGALLLLCASVVKAFVYDVWQLELAYRTLSFIGLGILLLVISFAYQRYGFSLIAKSEKDPGRLP